MPARGRSSPTPSCSVVRCESRSAGGPWGRGRSRLRSGGGARRATSPWRARRRPWRGSGTSCPEPSGSHVSPITKKRLFGVDRSGPPPRQTRSDQPLNPWTIPNAIGFTRLALIPVFLVVALNTDDGVDALSAVLFAVIGWADYLDGFAARLTGQYSRLGALL